LFWRFYFRHATRAFIGLKLLRQLKNIITSALAGHMITPAARISRNNQFKNLPGGNFTIIEKPKNRKMEPRAKTLIERLGFSDPDRKKYKHDEIQIWVYQNFRSIIKMVFPLLNVDENEPLEIKLEHPVSDNGYRNFIVGFVDVYCQKLSIGVEIKSEMPGIGDLIRQIQFYRKYITGSWIVVSPDDRNSDILIAQGIYFFKYRPKNKNQLQLFQ
jgi:hypothetical protein